MTSDSNSQYPHRPKPVGICKCGHTYSQHDFDPFPGNWLQRNCIFFWKACEGGKDCLECMCPKYEQVKVIDSITGIDIKESSK